jgi:molybdopterin molybdotransferase
MVTKYTLGILENDKGTMNGDRSRHDVRMRGFRDRAEMADLQQLLAARLSPLPPEEVSLHEAAGRVLSGDVSADVAVPSFDRAAMDGYALRGGETFGAGSYNPLEFEVIGQALPGRSFPKPVGSGQAVRIMTGAPLPEGADAVLPAEEAQEADRRLRVSEAVPPGRHVGRRGEDIEAGSVVLRAGRLLRPQDVGVLASIGHSPVAVIHRPAVAILTTGDELLPCGSRPGGYQIVDSNSVMLEALVRRDGGLPQTTLPIPDTYDDIRAALSNAAADVILVSGGSSVGQEDHAPRVLAEIGELCYHGVALRPASPTGLGFLASRNTGRETPEGQYPVPVFLLPGNPVSCLCAYDLFAGPAIRRLGGRAPGLPYRSATLPLARKLVSAVGRVDYTRVLVRDGQAEPLATSGASILSSTTRADGFVIVPRDSEGVAAGDTVLVYFYDP